MSETAHRLLSNAYRIDDSPYVCPSIFDSKIPLPEGTYYNAWKRILGRAGVSHVGKHGIRHRAATDIANSGIPVKVGMALTAHKTVSMFMRYVHTNDDPVRAVADKVANLRGKRSTAVRPQRRHLRRRLPTPMAIRLPPPWATTTRSGTGRQRAAQCHRGQNGPHRRS
jgi:hypothetical protein